MRLMSLQTLLLPLAISLASVFAPSFGNAQTAPAVPAGSEKKTSTQSGAQQSKRTTVNFEDQLVEGQTQKPELFYLLQQRNNNFKRLIKLRENFLPEMRKTSEEMNGKGSGS